MDPHAPAACGVTGIVGCRFSVFPMSDGFVDLIVGALRGVDTSKVWMETDDVSTCVRGRTAHVFDVVRAVFARVAASGVHTALTATFSVGCPGDTAGHDALVEDDVRANADLGADGARFTAAQFALYPMGVVDYLPIIGREVERLVAADVPMTGQHYATRLEGSIVDVFGALEQAFVGAQDGATHVLVTVTLSANSPSHAR